MHSKKSVSLARVVERVVPARLGVDFRRLLASTFLTNTGDGIAIAAGPLLIASQTRDPFLVSLALLVQFLPRVAFSIIGGVAADRFDRRRVVTVVDLVRAVVLVVLSATIVSGSVDISLVLVVLFTMATAETFADASRGSLVPNLVPRADLGIANARMGGAFLLMNQLIAPPIGALLFAVGMALPFATNAACFALGAVLVTRIRASVRPPVRERRSFRQDTAEGIRWLLGHPPMRTLALTIFAFNVTFGAAWAVLVLYAADRLGMDALGFGLLTTAGAVGGIIGTLAYGRLERRFSLADILRVGLLVETATHLVLAVTTVPVVALGTMVVFGAHAFIWGTTATVVRQRSVPDALLGRVTGVYQLAIVGGIAIGTPLGGALASAYGVTAPFWFGFAGSAILVVLLWRRFDDIAHGDSAAADDPGEAARGVAALT